MKTLKEFKLMVQIGTRMTLVKGTLHGLPTTVKWRGVQRVVCHIDRTAFALGLTVDAGAGARSWIEWPLRSNLDFPAPNQFTIIRAGQAVTYEYERVMP